MSIGQQGVYFDSSGSRILGTLFTGGEGPRPTAIVLHGMPGIEKNYDLMYALRSSGWNALLFHYRGTWGSEGSFSMEGTAPDTLAALDHLHSDAYDDVVDRERVFLVGHSMGGWAAVVAGLDERVRAVCASAPVVDATAVTFTEEDAEESFTPWIKGVTPARFIDQWHELPSALEIVGRLNKPLLVVHGEKDEVIPFHQGRELFEAASEPKRLASHPDANHAFMEQRDWWVSTVTGWLDEVSGA